MNGCCQILQFRGSEGDDGGPMLGEENTMSAGTTVLVHLKSLIWTRGIKLGGTTWREGTARLFFSISSIVSHGNNPTGNVFTRTH